MPIPGDYPGMTNSQLDSYISDFLTAIYGEEVRDKFARIAYLIGHQIPDSVEPSVKAAAASAAEAAEEAENAANQAEAAEDAKTAASQSAQQAANAASESQESASSAASAAAAAEAAQEAAENAAQNATDAAGGNFLPKSGGKLTGTLQETAGSYVWNGNGTSGIDGFVNIAEISLANTKYQNCPIELTVFRRRSFDRTRLIISFVGEDADDPNVECFRFDGAGSSTDFHLHKSATSTWQLYVKKSDPYDNIGIGEFHANFEHIKYKVTFNDTQVSSVPDGAIAATQLPVAPHNHSLNDQNITGILPVAKGGTGNSNGTVSHLTTPRTIDGVDFDGTKAIIHYGTCSTAAATAAKVVQCDGFKLVTGARIAVQFSNANTAASPTLNVNGTGAKRLCKHGTSYGSGWKENQVIEIVYDGTQYQIVHATFVDHVYNDISFKPYTSTRGENYLNLHSERYGNVVTLTATSIMQLPSASFNSPIETVSVPEGFRPDTDHYVHGMGVSGLSQIGSFRVTITAAGEIHLLTTDGRLAERHFTITYITSDEAVS